MRREERKARRHQANLAERDDVKPRSRRTETEDVSTSRLDLGSISWRTEVTSPVTMMARSGGAASPAACAAAAWSNEFPSAVSILI